MPEPGRLFVENWHCIPLYTCGSWSRGHGIASGGTGIQLLREAPPAFHSASARLSSGLWPPFIRALAAFHPGFARLSSRLWRTFIRALPDFHPASGGLSSRLWRTFIRAPPALLYGTGEDVGHGRGDGGAGEVCEASLCAPIMEIFVGEDPAIFGS